MPVQMGARRRSRLGRATVVAFALAGAVVSGSAGLVPEAAAEENLESESQDRSRSTSASPAVASAQAAASEAAAESGEPTPVPELTTPQQLVWAQPDGSFSAKLSASPVRVEVDGSWVDLDPTLREVDGLITPTAALGQVSISAGGEAGAVLAS